MPHRVVTTASIKVSCTPSPSMVIMSVVRCMPTFRTRRSDRLLIVPCSPLARVIAESGFNFLIMVCDPFTKLVSRVPFIKPSQLAYAVTLSSASTVATESSQSMIVLTADSTITSAIFAESVEPIWSFASIIISMCKLFLRRNIESGLSISPV